MGKPFCSVLFCSVTLLGWLDRECKGKRTGVCKRRGLLHFGQRTWLIVGCVEGRVVLFGGREFVTSELNAVLVLRDRGRVKGVGG